jgi:hypothetical protein
MIIPESVIKLRKIVEEQSLIISSQQAQIKELNKLLNVAPVEAFECLTTHHSNLKMEVYKRSNRSAVAKVVNEMKSLIEICTNSSSSHFQKEKAKKKLLRLDKVRVNGKLKI